MGSSLQHVSDMEEDPRVTSGPGGVGNRVVFRGCGAPALHSLRTARSPRSSLTHVGAPSITSISLTRAWGASTTDPIPIPGKGPRSPSRLEFEGLLPGFTPLVFLLGTNAHADQSFGSEACIVSGEHLSSQRTPSDGSRGRTTRTSTPHCGTGTNGRPDKEKMGSHGGMAVVVTRRCRFHSRAAIAYRCLA